jgi:hypothetical protein
MRQASQCFVEDSLSDAILDGFLKEGDAAMIKLAALSKDGKDRSLLFETVTARRLRRRSRTGTVASVPLIPLHWHASPL